MKKISLAALALLVALLAALSAFADHMPRHGYGVGGLYEEAQRCKAGQMANPHCLTYVKSGDYVVLQDGAPGKEHACLVVPTIRVSGIEDKQTVTNTDVGNLFADGWSQHENCLKNAPAPGKGKAQPSGWVGLAINPEDVRSQNQLHIHLSCLAPEINSMFNHPPTIPHTGWVDMKIHGHTWHAQALTSLEGKQSPFEVIQSRATTNKKDDNYIGWHSVLVVSDRKGGFYLLDAWHENGHKPSAEGLLDETCNH